MGAAGQNHSFVREITAFGDRRELVSRESIWSHGGVKLLDAGTRIDSRLVERLGAHRLRVPLETSVTTPDAVDTTTLAMAAMALVDDHPLYRRIGAQAGAIERLHRDLQRAAVPSALGFVLAVMRETRPELFDHSVKVTTLALHLAGRRGLGEAARAELAVAAIAHDVGTLHVDPALLARGRRLDPLERRHVYAHPVTAQLMLGEYGGIPVAVRSAVLEHHERNDGTGYPRGVSGAAISPLGHILMICEIVAVLFDRHEPARGAFELPVLLKLSRRKFDRALVDELIAFFGGGAAPGDLVPGADTTVATLAALASANAAWRELRARPEFAGHGRALAEVAGSVDLRLAELARSMLETGVVMDSPPEPATWLGDGVAESEMALLAREAAWQLREAVHEVRRRHGETLATDAARAAPLTAWLDAVEAALVGVDVRP